MIIQSSSLTNHKCKQCGTKGYIEFEFYHFELSASIKVRCKWCNWNDVVADVDLLYIANKHYQLMQERKKDSLPDQPASEKQKSEIEFLLAEKGISIIVADEKLSRKFNRVIKMDFPALNSIQAAWLIKELSAL